MASRRPATDIQAVLTVLGRRKYRHKKGEKESLDLRSTDLRGADLQRAYLEGAELSNAHLEGANLTRAHFERAYFNGTHLEDAYLVEARLDGAWLMEAHLERAELWGAYVKDALLMGAHLEGANFVAPPIGRFPFEDTTGLTRKQLSEAIVDENTKLPDYLQEQSPEGKGPARNREE
jgi:hypothetical protein